MNLIIYINLIKVDFLYEWDKNILLKKEIIYNGLNEFVILFLELFSF